jgi:beta-lactamase regulating signal transducer with metallopeptidase domain
MNWVYLISGGWLLHCALGGGLLLLLVYGLMRRTTQPARQQRLGEWGMVAALLLAVLSLCPAWLIIPVHLAVPVEAPPTMRAEAPPATAPAPRKIPHPGPLSGTNAREFPGEEENGEGIPLDIRRWRLSIPAPGTEPAETIPLAAPAAPGESASLPAPPESPPQTVGAFSPAVAPLLSSALRPLGRWLGLAWVGAAALLLARWLFGHFLLWRLLRKAEPAPVAVARLFAEMTPGKRPPRLLISHRLRVPLSCGLLRPTVVLPASLCEPTPALRWVLAHELTHLERRDVWTCLLFGFGQVMYFYLPWFWWLRRQVGLCQEYLADAAVADREARAEEYAEFLVSLTTGPAAPAVATGVSGRPSDLFRRVTMLLEAPVRLEQRCPWFWSGTAAAGLGVAAVLLAGVGLTAAPVTDLPPVVAVKDLPETEDHESRIDDRELKSENRGSPDNLDSRPGFPQKEGAVLAGGLPRTHETDEDMLGADVRQPEAVMADQLNLPPGMGLLVERITPGSPAARAGLREHDILLAVDGHEVSRSPADLKRLLEETQAGASVEVVVLRKGKRQTIRGLVLSPSETIPPASQPWAATPFPGMSFAGPGSGAASVVTTLAWVGDRFTTRHQEGTLVITISGRGVGSQLRVRRIEVADGVVVVHFDDAGSVPARYGDKARSLLEWSAAANPSPREGAR